MNKEPDLTLRSIYKVWWPLAASWLLMGLEAPALSAIVARLPNPAINLAAYGGIVFPLSLILESPIIMLLAASTALSKDWHAFSKMRKYMLVSGATITILHFLMAFTPIYFIVVRDIIGVPEDIIQPARWGLMIMTPWSFAIGYRRFHQGVLIRFGYSKRISIGTVIRLLTDGTLLILGYMSGSLPGIVVGTAAIIGGVITEAVYVGLVVRPVLRNELKHAPETHPRLTLKSFLDFYVPLATTSLLFLLAQPLISAAISRMPNSIESLALWPVVSGLIFMYRSVGLAYNEVVVSLLDKTGAIGKLQKFTTLLSIIITLGLIITIITPLDVIWFRNISGLAPRLVKLALSSLWLALPLPALTVIQNWYQGIILFGRKTRSITVSIVLYLITTLIVLVVGVSSNRYNGVHIGLVSIGASLFVQAAWLGFMSRSDVKKLQQVE